jgi:hypothetical protein
MKKTLLFGCCLLSLPLCAARENWGEDDAIAIWGDVAFFRRAEGNNHRLIIDEGTGKLNSSGCCSSSACESRKLLHDFHYEPGFKVGIAYMTPHSILEATYLWIRQWESACHKSDPGEIFFSEKNPDITNDFSGADSASAHYLCQFQNAEVNYFWYNKPRRENWFAAAWIVGVRYIFFSDILNISFQNGSDQSSYNIHVKNHIPVLHVGGVVTWNPGRVFSWDLLAKVGMGADCYNQHTFLGDLNNTVTVRNYNASKISTPFLAEAALAFTYQPLTWFNLHIAYQMIYLNGVALAPDQLVKSSNNEHRARAIGQVIFHGWTAGLMFSF